MYIDKHNAEGYSDPTAFHALINIVRTEKRHTRRPHLLGTVFICSPYSGNVKENTRRACRYCRYAADQYRIPYAPHLLFPQFLDENDPEQRDLGIRMGLVFLEKCREVWVFGKPTAGMCIEIERAKKRRIPIRYFNENCEEVVG